MEGRGKQVPKNSRAITHINTQSLLEYAQGLQEPVLDVTPVLREVDTGHIPNPEASPIDKHL